MRFAALVLAALLAPGAAVAQELRAGLLVPWPTRTDAVHAAVVTATARTAGAHTLRAQLRRYWPAQETAVTQTIALGDRARTVTLPIPFGPNDDGSVALLPERSTAPLAAGNPGNPRDAQPNFVAVLGLGAGRVAQIDSGATQSRSVAALVARTPEGAALFAPLPAAWGGAQVIVTETGALLDAPADARSQLGDWVLAGGVLAFTARSPADLRHPWLRGLLGELRADPAGLAEGPWLRPALGASGRRHGVMRDLGLGALVLLDGDLSLESDDGATRAALRGFAASVGEGGGLVAPGDLALWRRVEERAVQRQLRGPTNVRPALVPVAIALALYVVAVGVLLSRNRARRDPLRVFVTVPAAGFAILALVFGLSVALRSHRSASRVLCVWDLGSGARRAVLRRLGGATAARPQSFSLRPGVGEIALARTSAASAGGALRWDGARGTVEGARIGLWETAMFYTEGVVDTGGEIDVRLEGEAVVVENHSGFTLREAVFLRERAIVRLPTIAPGGRAAAPAAPSEVLPARGEPGRTAFGWAGAPLAALFFDELLDDIRYGGEQPSLLARVDVDEATRAMMQRAGFPLMQGEALIRVVSHASGDPRAPRGRPSNRVGARTWVLSEAVPSPATPWDADAATDAAADADGAAP